ncbi:dapdiamide synthesis protein DdaC-like isoform X2 [Clytia hemisphaerica]|uniref:dapdiamide synthesis protein DdaC-like isoform X2 n=1 Tax=Clytia hemisphaerica TaxID=252671 RepID=UPI0034D799E9
MKIRKIIKETKRSMSSEPLFTEIHSLCQQQPTIKCQNRKFLAGSTSKDFPETLPKFVHHDFKAIKITHKHRCQDIKRLGVAMRPALDSMFKAKKSAVLIKGLPISVGKDFHDFVEGCAYKAMTYESGSGFRAAVDDLVYTASDEPPPFSIEPHNEMSYLSKFPQKIIFCCLSTADKGGESPIVFNRDLIKKIKPEVLNKFRAKGIRYSRNLKHRKNTDYISWQSTFYTEEEKEAEKKMSKEGFQWEWKANGDVTIWYQQPAFYELANSGEEVWFNQMTANHCSYYKSHPMFADRAEDLPAHEYPYHCCYGDGEEIENDVMDHIRSVAWKNAMSLTLLPGDVLILDNLLCQHSRIGYEGGDRRILVFLGEHTNR